MADEKQNTGPEVETTTQAPAPEQESPGAPPAPEQSSIPGMDMVAPTPADQVIDLAGIQAQRDQEAKAAAPVVGEKSPEEKQGPKRRGRPPKEQAEVGTGKAAKGLRQVPGPSSG